MRILHLSALPVWSMEGKGGMPSLRETLKGHLRAGHEIELVVPHHDLFSNDQTPLPVRRDQGYTVHVARCRWLGPIKQVRALVLRASGGKLVPYPVRWLLNVSTLLCLTVSLFQTARKVRRAGFVPDLIYAHNQYAALAAFLLRCRWRVPNVTRLYGTFLADLMRKPFVALRYPTAAAGYLVPSSLLICANDGTRGDEVAQKFGIPAYRFRFWQNGVEPPEEPPALTRQDLVNRFGQGLRAGSKWAVSCSRLSYWKRIDRMLHGLAVCRDAGVDCQLVVAGEGPERERLQALASELDLADAVVWLGAVPHNEIWALMNAADVFLITNDVTNRCNPLYEAAWASLPVVSVRDVSTSDLLRDRENALLAGKEDTEGLGRNLVEICRDEALARHLRREQRRLAETFWTWEERMRIEVGELVAVVSGAEKAAFGAGKPKLGR